MQSHPAATTQRQRGAVLIPILLFMLLIAGLSVSLLLEVEGSVISVHHQETSLMALEVAEMGIVQAELEIRGERDGGGDGIGNVSAAYGRGSYVVTAVEDPALEGRWTLTAVGTVGHSVRRIEVGVRRRGHQRAVEGLYSKEALTFGGGSTTDAFDSRLGPYTAQAVNGDGGGSYALTGGHIGSGMGISLLGSSSYVRGNAIPGSGFQTEVSGGATVLGDTLPRRTTIEVPPTPYADFLAAYSVNDNGQVLGAYSVVDPEEGLPVITDPDLAGLSDLEVEGMKRADMLPLTDAQVGGLKFDDLLTTAYPALVKTVDPVVLSYSTAEYEKSLYDGALVLGTGREIVAIDSDAYELGQTGGTLEGGEVTNYPAMESSQSMGAAGRVSYNASTREVRATAGAEIVLEGGVYFFSNFRLVGNSRLIVRGPSILYVTGRLDLGGGSVINETGKAESLQIHAHGYALPTGYPPSTTLVKLRGGASIGAVIYAPDVDVTIGGGDHFYGSIVGKRISLLGGVHYHFDKALGDMDANKGAVLERLYWREPNKPQR